MKEMDKALAGAYYNAMDAELLEARKECNQKCRHYNNLTVGDEKGQMISLHSILGKVEGHLTIMPPFYCDYGFNITMGEATFINFNCTILDEAQVTFGRHVLVGPNCSFVTAKHPIDPLDRKTGNESAEPITIEDNVWLGTGVIVNPGVRIGCNSVIGSGSVVTKDIPANCVAFGNPCRYIREIDESDKINQG